MSDENKTTGNKSGSSEEEVASKTGDKQVPETVTKDQEGKQEEVGKTEGDQPVEDSEKTEEEQENDETQEEEDKKEQTIDEIVGEVAEEEGEGDFTKTPEREFQERTKEMVLPTLLKFFRPELINRFDDVIFFHPLRKEDLKLIVEIMLREPREMLREKNIEFRLSDEAKDFLSVKGYNPAFGARPLRRAIQTYMEDPLSDHLLAEDFISGDTIFIDINEPKDGLTFEKDIADEKDDEELDPYAELDEENAGDDEEGEKGEENEDSEGEDGDKEGKEEDASDSEDDGDSSENEEENPSTEESSDEEGDASEKKKGSFFSSMFNKKEEE